jgi:hypothetical protein
LGIVLVLAAAVLFLVQILIFHDPRNTFFYLFQDLAFIPFQVLLVTLILNRLLSVREKQAMLQKMNMVIGVFFNQVGVGLLQRFIAFDRDPGRLRDLLASAREWPPARFQREMRELRHAIHAMDAGRADLGALKVFLLDQRDFLLRLLENANLLEHETFTDLLWAVFHLADELDHRPDVTVLAPADADHLALDMARAYQLLLVEWLAYMVHLKENYPYLFSLALRTNPFDPDARVEMG